MSRDLKDLDKRLYPIACELIATCIEQGIQVMIITTGRTIAEQLKAVNDKVSWTMNSKHLPQPPDGKSLAIDICPFDIYQLNGPDKLMWDDRDPVWQQIGKIGRVLGLKWGVVINGVHKDLGHFEYLVAGQMPSHNQKTV